MDPKTGALVVELRAQGLTAKAIARRLALRPAEVVPLIRGLAARREADPPPPLAACYVSPSARAGARVWAFAVRRRGGASSIPAARRAMVS